MLVMRKYCNRVMYWKLISEFTSRGGYWILRLLWRSIIHTTNLWKPWRLRRTLAFGSVVFIFWPSSLTSPFGRKQGSMSVWARLARLYKKRWSLTKLRSMEKHTQVRWRIQTTVKEVIYFAFQSSRSRIWAVTPSIYIRYTAGSQYYWSRMMTQLKWRKASISPLKPSDQRVGDV